MYILPLYILYFIYLILFLTHTYTSHLFCTTCLILFKYLYFIIIFLSVNFKCALFVSSPAAIALAIQMYSFCHANKAHLNWNWIDRTHDKVNQSEHDTMNKGTNNMNTWGQSMTQTGTMTKLQNKRHENMNIKQNPKPHFTYPPPSKGGSRRPNKTHKPNMSRRVMERRWDRGRDRGPDTWRWTGHGSWHGAWNTGQELKSWHGSWDSGGPGSWGKDRSKPLSRGGPGSWGNSDKPRITGGPGPWGNVRQWNNGGPGLWSRGR